METIDTKTGFCPETKIFHSLRPKIYLPSETTLLSAASYALSLHSTSPFPDSTAALINSATGHTLSYSHFIHQINNLIPSLQSLLNLSKNDVAYILSPNTTHIPILYLSLLSIGVIISPANPVSTSSEISRQLQIAKPVIAFATSETAHKVPKLKYGTVVIESMMKTRASCEVRRVNVKQSDVAAIMYSSGTTGEGKGVMITHRNLIAAIACHYALRREGPSATVVLYTLPYFHIFGFIYCIRSVALKETAVVMERYELTEMLRAVEEFRVNIMPAVPPIVVAMVKEPHPDHSHFTSLNLVACGGAPLGKYVITKFAEKYPNVLLAQGYALTETTGVAFRAFTPEEIFHWGSVGKMLSTFEAKIVDPTSGASLPPRRRGELWLRAPSIMKGYVDNAKATSDTVVSDGWLRTGDICYFDSEGHLFVVDRLKELIKYKGYQVPPAELEELLLSHPQILDVAVIPYPDEEAGEVPMAFVARHSQSSLDESKVMDFVAKQVAPYKKVRRVRFITSIPKTPAGKILRKDLRQLAILESKI